MQKILFPLLSLLGVACTSPPASTTPPHGAAGPNSSGATHTGQGPLATGTTTPPGGGGVDSGTTPPPTLSPPHTRCGWLMDDAAGEASFVGNASWFQAVHPYWFQLNSDGATILTLGGLDKASIVAAARANNVKLMPMIYPVDDTGLRTLIASPTLIQKHADDLVALMRAHGYAGMDIDYEHLQGPTERAQFNNLMQALSSAFHANGFELSMAIDPIAADTGYAGYDYATLSSVCDELHVMAYDYHWVGGDHLGPIAPLGWLDAAFARAEATGRGDRFILGVANFAIGSGYYTTPRDALSQCTSPPATTTDETMTTCPYTHYPAGRSLSCPTAAHGMMWSEDLASMEEKLLMAKSHGARGITYFTIGDELPGFFQMVKSHYP